MFFTRRTPGVEVDTKQSDTGISYGEVNADILESFLLILHGAFLPILQGGMQDWGRIRNLATSAPSDSGDCTFIFFAHPFIAGLMIYLVC
jgi:hypothetical protein